ncbi:MAG TPA: hypothetical protein VIH89_00335 [Candidatus Sulfotelmatobacter sp.]|jgi:hypothetical protein
MRLFATRRLAILLLLCGIWTAPAFGQACAMCYATARATPKEAQKTINRAIFVLLFPPLGIMGAGVGFAFRYGKKRDLENSQEERCE